MSNEPVIEQKQQTDFAALRQHLLEALARARLPINLGHVLRKQFVAALADPDGQRVIGGTIVGYDFAITRLHPKGRLVLHLSRRLSAAAKSVAHEEDGWHLCDRFNHSLEPVELNLI